MKHTSTSKRQRRVRRQAHRRRPSKAEVENTFGEGSGMRKHVSTSRNPKTKHNRSTKPRKVLQSRGQRILHEEFKKAQATGR